MPEFKSEFPKHKKELENLKAKQYEFMKTAAPQLARIDLERQQGILKLDRSARKQTDEVKKQWAKFRFDNAKSIRLVDEFCPQLPHRLIDRYIGLPITLERLRALRAEWSRIFGIWVDPIDPCRGRRPTITSAPAILRVGETHTLIGEGFGTTVGTLNIHLDSPDVDITVPTSAWSDNAITFAVPTTGIPLVILQLEPCTIKVVRGDAAPTTGWHCSGSIGATFERTWTVLMSHVDNSDVVHLTGVSTSYSRDFVVTSLPLPAGAELVEVYPDAFSFDINDTSNQPQPTIIAGPTLSGSSYQVTVRVTDDYPVNYWLFTWFTISQPVNATVPAGWTVVG